MCILCLVQLHVLGSFPFCEPGPRVLLFVLACVFMVLFALKCPMLRFHVRLFSRQQLHAGASQISAGSNPAPVHLNSLALVAQVQDERNVFHKSPNVSRLFCFVDNCNELFWLRCWLHVLNFFWSA